MEASKKILVLPCIGSYDQKRRCFQEVSKFFEKEGLSWDNVCGNTTDGATAMLGSHQAKVKDTNPDTKHLHCMIHQYALASKTLQTELRVVLHEVITMVNAIKASALSTRLFQLLCQDFDEQQENLLYHTEAREPALPH